MAKLTKTQVALLTAVALATRNGGYEYASGKDQKALLDLGLVEANAAIANEAGATATRSTGAGEAYLNELNSTNQAGEQVEQLAEKPKFVIASNIEIPQVTRTRQATSLYPFDDLELGQSFFVPVSEDKPDPAKSLASTVTSANDRYSFEIDGEFETNRKGETVPKKGFNRRFIVRAVEDGAAWGYEGVAGAGVWRVEPK